jgi:hypothetical protein
LVKPHVVPVRDLAHIKVATAVENLVRRLLTRLGAGEAMAVGCADGRTQQSLRRLFRPVRRWSSTHVREVGRCHRMRDSSSVSVAEGD